MIGRTSVSRKAAKAAALLPVAGQSTDNGPTNLAHRCDSRSRWAWLVLSLALGCGDETGPVDGEAAVVVIIAEVDQAGLNFQRVTLHLENTGGPGTYAVELYGLPSSANPGGTFFGRSEPVDVDAEYDEAVPYDLTSDVPVTHALVFSRNEGSATYRETDRYDFPDPE